MNKLIYIADDEENIRHIMQMFLEKEGFQTEGFADAQALSAQMQQKMPDLIILDIMMPGEDGLSFCAKIRERSRVPIIIVSAKGNETDRITGITLGSDDYIAKPFSPLELVVRVKALLRRAGYTAENQPSKSVSFGDIMLEKGTREAFCKQKLLALTPTEFDFLDYMITSYPNAVSREKLLKELWQFDFETDTRVADDLVKRLRKKLLHVESGVVIETVWGFGFRLKKEK